jgi:hypothetical protein
MAFVQGIMDKLLINCLELMDIFLFIYKFSSCVIKIEFTDNPRPQNKKKT